MKIVLLFDVKLGRCDPTGYCPPVYMDVKFKTLDGKDVVGVTGQLETPRSDYQGSTSVDTVFIENFTGKVFRIHEVMSWEDPELPYPGAYQWATTVGGSS